MTDALMYLIAGGRGSGKTSLARSMLASRRRVVVFDPLDDYKGLGFAVARSVKAVAHGLAKKWSGEFRIRYVPPANHEPEALHALSVLLRKAQQPFKDGRDNRQIALAVDEMNMSFPNYQLPVNLSGFPELCSRGRHFGIEVIGITQRLAEVNTRFRGNAEVQFYLRQDDHSDVTAAVAKLGPKWRETLLSLENYKFLRRWQGKVTIGHTMPFKKIGGT